MQSIDWKEVIASSLSSATLLAGLIVGVGFLLRDSIKKYIDRRLDMRFDIELKRHEISIENLKVLAEHARKIILLYPGLITNIRTAALGLIEGDAIGETSAQALRIAVDELNAKLSEYFVVTPPVVHQAVHSCKEAGSKVLISLKNGNRINILQAVDNVEFKRAEALAKLREWANSLGTSLPNGR